MDKTKIVIEGIGEASNLITWCTIQEHLYSRRGSDAESRLQLALKELYKVILRFLAKAIRFFNSTLGTYYFTMNSLSTLKHLLYVSSITPSDEILNPFY